MRKIIAPLLGLTICAAMIIPAFACLWDYDTLQMENQRFPDALELITGKFLRHSTEFYQWRIADRIRKLENDPHKLEYFDDLAVAYEKTGDHQKAIETILKKDKLKPDQYETLANLGTFYIFDNQLEKSVPCIERAIAINPDAHFGREVYQKLLVQYALSKMKDGAIPFPLSDHTRHFHLSDDAGFLAFVLKSKGIENQNSAEWTAEAQRAVTGVLGMMKFARHDSPLLLEALGDLLLCGRRDDDAKQLAARAYLKASYEVKDAKAKQAYRNLAGQALMMQMKNGVELELPEMEKEFAAELKDADSWYAYVREDELRWIQSGMNPEEQFNAKYYVEPRTAIAWEIPFMQYGLPGFALAMGLIALVSYYFFDLWRRKRAKRKAS